MLRALAVNEADRAVPMLQGGAGASARVMRKAREKVGLREVEIDGLVRRPPSHRRTFPELTGVHSTGGRSAESPSDNLGCVCGRWCLRSSSTAATRRRTW